MIFQPCVAPREDCFPTSLALYSHCLRPFVADRSRFYVFHFVCAFIALVETAVVHTYIRAGKDGLALRVDVVFRTLMPYVVYPVCLIGLMIWAAFDQEAVGFALVITGILLPIAVGAIRVKIVHAMALRTKAKIAVELVTAPEDVIQDTSEVPLMRRAFSLFDIDSSGDIDAKEVRSLIDAMYPAMPREHRKHALKLIVSGEGGMVKFEDFDETILEWRKYVEENDPSHMWQGSTSRRKLVRRLSTQASLPTVEAVEVKATETNI